MPGHTPAEKAKRTGGGFTPRPLPGGDANAKRKKKHKLKRRR